MVTFQGSLLVGAPELHSVTAIIGPTVLPLAQSGMETLPSYALYCYYKLHDEKLLGKERLFGWSLFIEKEPGGRKGNKLQRNTVYLLATRSSLSLLYHITQKHLPSGGPAHRELDHPASITNQENAPPQIANLMSISSAEVPLPDNCSW